MKRFFTMVFLAANISLFSQTTIPNAGFENWTSQGSYENPDFWDSPNESTSSLGIVVAEAENSIVYEGSYSAKISVQSSIFGALPGVLTLADFNFDLFSFTSTIDGGTPFTGRPERFSGWFQYEPQNNDECLFGAILLKENGGTYDTVGTAGFTNNQTLLTWTRFETAFEYRTTDAPTHLNIILLPTDINNPQVNSVVYVDALDLTYANAVPDDNISQTKVYLDGDQLHFPEMNSNEKNINIFDINGRCVFEKTQTENSIAISDFQQGVYIIRIQSDNKVYNAKFIN